MRSTGDTFPSVSQVDRGIAFVTCVMLGDHVFEVDERGHLSCERCGALPPSGEVELWVDAGI